MLIKFSLCPIPVNISRFLEIQIKQFSMENPPENVTNLDFE